MDASKLFFCFEAENSEGHPVYYIYSVKLDYFTSSSSPKTKREAVIKYGVPYMGCGVFGSKIVLAGGLVKGEKMSYKQKMIITYDMATKIVSKTDIPPMREGKSNPLVFQLHNKLFVLDTSLRLRRRAFEIYYPKRNHWHTLWNPYRTYTECYIHNVSRGTFRYSWFVFGKCLCISFPRGKYTALYDAQSFNRDFTNYMRQPLPFSGMATTYYQEGFKNIVVISFFEGRVEGRRLYDEISFGSDDPQLIFEAEPSSRPQHDIFGYLSQIGDGFFCLTTFDQVDMHVYTFKIFRAADKPDGSLVLNLLSKNICKYDLAHFPMKDSRFVRLVSCFGPSKYNRKKEHAEAYIYRREFSLLDEEYEDDDDKFRPAESPDIVYDSEGTEPEDEPDDFSHLEWHAKADNALHGGSLSTLIGPLISGGTEKSTV